MENELIYTKMPGVFSTCIKIIFLRRSGFYPGYNLPRISASAENITIDKGKLKRYIEICGLKDDGMLPLLYPHVFTAPLQMAVVSHKNFPVSCLGILHYRNHIIQHRPINADEILRIEVELTESRIVRQGVEIDYTIHVTSEDEPVWESVTTYLKKGKFGTESQESPDSNVIQSAADAVHYADFYIPDNIGNEYSKVCSDYNPIHLSKAVAKLFGYKGKVAHAMWAAACSMGSLPEISTDKPVRIDLAFKGPLFAGDKSYIKTSRTDDYIRFDYYCGDNRRPCINGKMSYVDKGTHLI